jgi:hypothetical protein
MKSRHIGLTTCMAVLVISLGLFILLQANSKDMLPASTTAQALLVTSTTPAMTGTAGAQSSSTFTGRYFTIQVPPSWDKMTHNANNVNGYGIEVEDAEWHINSIEGAYVDVRVRYWPYSEAFPVADYTPFQAGELKGATRTWTYTDIGSTNVQIVLPGTPDHSGPIYYLVWLQMPMSLPQDEQDLITRLFEEAVASLIPSQEALQGTPTAIPAPLGVPACSAVSLAATVDGQGCTGFFCGLITLTNMSEPTCSIAGRPVIKYISQDGKSLPVSQYSLPPALGNAKSAVILKPGESAIMFYRTSSGQCSWQERVPITASWVMELPGVLGRVTLREESALSVCGNNLPIVASWEVGTFEPAK